MGTRKGGGGGRNLVLSPPDISSFLSISLLFFLPVTNRDVQKGKQHEIWG